MPPRLLLPHRPPELQGATTHPLCCAPFGSGCSGLAGGPLLLPALDSFVSDRAPQSEEEMAALRSGLGGERTLGMGDRSVLLLLHLFLRYPLFFFLSLSPLVKAMQHDVKGTPTVVLPTAGFPGWQLLGQLGWRACRPLGMNPPSRTKRRGLFYVGGMCKIVVAAMEASVTESALC